jgi:hypothetical protein
MSAVISTLADIRLTFRSVTANQSPEDFTDTQIDLFINKFYIYYLPSELKLLDLKDTFVFYTQPNVDTYAFDTVNYYSVQTPLYVAGIESQYTQNRGEFYRYWPKIAYKQQLGTGDGVTLTFSPNTQFGLFLRSIDQAIDPFEQFKEVLITTFMADGSSFIIVDQGGAIGNVGNLITRFKYGTTPAGTIVGSVNYFTGALTFTYPVGFPPAQQSPIEIQYTPFQPSRPQSMLFYNNYFTLRPVPDDVYEVCLDAFVTPTTFLSTQPQATPVIQQWSTLLAYGASKIFFEQQLDTESMARLQPFYQEQLSMVERRTLEQLVGQRSQTIFTDSRWIPFTLTPPYY